MASVQRQLFGEPSDRLGEWMSRSLIDVGEVKAYRDDTAAAMQRIEQRLTAIDHLFTDAAEHWARVERRQTRADKRLESLERIDRARGERTL